MTDNEDLSSDRLGAFVFSSESEFLASMCDLLGDDTIQCCIKRSTTNTITAIISAASEMGADTHAEPLFVIDRSLFPSGSSDRDNFASLKTIATTFVDNYPIVIIVTMHSDDINSVEANSHATVLLASCVTKDLVAVKGLRIEPSALVSSRSTSDLSTKIVFGLSSAGLEGSAFSGSIVSAVRNQKL